MVHLHILECLYTPPIEYAAPLAQELLRIRSVFLSKMIYGTYNGYAMSQFKKIEQDLRTQHRVKWKHAMHLLPFDNVVGLEPGRETVESSRVWEGREIDLVTHDAKKFFKLLLKKNGYVLEQLLSPLVVLSTPEHDELKAIARKCVTRLHAHHYLGFSKTQWELFLKETPPRVKPLLYVYRVLLTGIHLMRTGEIDANLVRLNQEYQLPYVDELIQTKTSGEERARIQSSDIEFHRGEYTRLTAVLEKEMVTSRLPETPGGIHELNDLLVKIRRSMLPVKIKKGPLAHGKHGPCLTMHP